MGSSISDAVVEEEMTGHPDEMTEGLAFVKLHNAPIDSFRIGGPPNMPYARNDGQLGLRVPILETLATRGIGPKYVSSAEMGNRGNRPSFHEEVTILIIRQKPNRRKQTTAQIGNAQRHFVWENAFSRSEI